MRNEEQFVSFMVENDDSQLYIPQRILKDADEDYFKSLSRQFYGSKSQDVKKQLKNVKSAGEFKMKIKGSINSVLQPSSVSQQLQQQIHKLLSKPKPTMQSLTSSFKATQKMNSIRLTYQQLQNRKLILPKNDDSNVFTQNSYRSTLNTSTKSQPKQDKALDIYQMKVKTERSVEKPKLLKVLKRNKLH